MQIYLAVTPAEVRSASSHCHSFAHVAYRVGAGSELQRQNLLVQTKGGLLGLSDTDAPPILAPDALCGQILQECNRRGYSGVLADFESPPTPDRRGFLERLAALLRRNRRTLYAPEDYRVPGALSLLCTALSGGNLNERLKSAVSPMTALDVTRLRMDFPLPSPTGEGRPLTLAALGQLQAELSPAVFYSPELCARYFTYTRDGAGHFILYDDADTLVQKLRLGASLGYSAAFLQYPEVADILPQIFSKLSKRG